MQNQNDVKDQLFDICDKALASTINLLQVDIVIGLGRFAEKRTLEVAKKYNIVKDVKVIIIEFNFQ